MNFEAHLFSVAAELKRKASYGVNHDRQDAEDTGYRNRCRLIDNETGTLLLYTRDADEDVPRLYPGQADGCLHLSFSPAPTGIPYPDPLSPNVARCWLVEFFGPALEHLWFERPKTKLGKQFQVHHARRLTLNWQPVDAQLGAELAALRGWLRAPEFFSGSPAI